MTFGTLTIDMVAKFAQFEAGLDKAVRASQKSAQQIASAFSLVRTAAGGLAAGISVGGLIALTRASIDSIDALNDVADATGATIENISALEDVAARTGTSMDTVAGALVKFNDSLKNAKPDSSIAKAFDAIGLSVEELKRLDPAEALRRTAVALSGYADDGNKARLVQEAFGRSVREVAPFLKDLAEQGKLVATVTGAQAAEAEKFNKQLFELQKNFQDLSRLLAGDVVRSINAAADAYRQSGLLAGIEALFSGDAEFKSQKRLVDLTENLLQVESVLQKQRAAGFADDSRYVKASLDRLAAIKTEIAGIRALRSAGDDDNQSSAEARRLGLVLTTRPSVSFDAAEAKVTKGRSKGSGTKNASDDITEAQRALASYVDGLQDALDRTQDLTATEKALNFLRFQGAQGQIPQVRELVLGLAQQIDKKKELVNQLEREEQALVDIDRVLGDIAAKEAARIGALDDQINELSGRAGDDRKRALTERLESQLNAGAVFSSEELDRIVRGIGGVTEQLEKTKSLSEELGLTFTSAFEDAIVSGGKFSDVLKGLEQDILRIVTRKLVTEPLGNAITGALGGSGGIGGFFSSIFGSIFGGAKAEGGPVTGGVPYLVGERGPELFMPQGSGTIVPNHAMAGRAMTIHINPPAGMSRQASSQFAADVARQLRMAEARNG